MSSFYAELEVSGHTYPVRTCQFTFTQATGERGRVNAKVRHGLVYLSLDVPDDEVLADWGHAAHKPLAGHVTFFETDRRTARETLSFTAGHCVSYHESFVAGHGAAGAYVCKLTVTTEQLVLTPGGPPRPLATAAARDYAPPAAVAPLAAVAGLTKQQRYDARMNLMGSAQGKLAHAPNEPAQTALERLGRNNVAVERARLSGHVYDSDKIPPVDPPEGWHMLDAGELAKKGVSPEMLLDSKSGFKAAMYQSSFERPPKLVVAYAGTENGSDWKTNLLQGSGLKSEQYNRAMRLAKTVSRTTDPLDVEATGHSLGGGLASAASVVAGIKGYTFNAAGLHASTVRRPPYDVSRAAMLENGALIDAYRSTADPLNNLQKASVVTRGLVLPKALGVSHVLEPAEKWKHTWSELVKGNPLKAATAMALNGHGVNPQMVDHIEAEKDVDTATLTKYVGS